MSNAHDKEITRRNGFLGFLTTDMSQFKIIGVAIASIIIPKLINTGDRSLDNQVITLVQLVLGISVTFLYYVYRQGIIYWLKECKYSLFYFNLRDCLTLVSFVLVPSYLVHVFIGANVSSFVRDLITASLPAVVSNLCIQCVAWCFTIAFISVSFSIWFSQASIRYIFDINHDDINFYYISFRVLNKYITEAQFKHCNTINDPQEIDMLYKYVNKNVLHNSNCRTDTIIREYRISQAYSDKDDFDYNKGFVDSIQNKRINFQLLPLYRYGRFVEECVYASSMIATNDIKLYCDSEQGLRDFIKCLCDNHGHDEDSTTSKYKDIQANKYFAGRICRVFKADRLGNSGAGVIKMVPADINNTINPLATFETLFYPEKDQLLNMLNKFKQRRMYTGGLSHMPNTLGMMLTGAPGNGKTATVSAIANYLGRDVHEINLRRLKNRNELEAILQTVEYSKKIIMFDEFDCMAGVLKSRKQLETQAKAMESVESAALSQALLKGEDVSALQRKMKEDRDRQDQLIDLGWFLTWFDGACKHEDKIVIATTNYVDNIDPALLRPGRFTYRIELSLCNHDMIVNIIKRSIGEYLSPEEMTLLHNHTVPDKKWSPRDLIEKIVSCFDHEDKTKDLQYLLKRLHEDPPMTCE